jgi:hypothetical protein
MNLDHLTADIFITVAIVLKLVLDPIVIWISFQITHFLIERILISTKD